MTRNPRDEREWTNRELQDDPQGYLAAQQARREDEALAEQTRRDADDLEHFADAFAAAGGDRSDARAAFKKHRADRAIEAGIEEDRAAAAASRQRIRIKL